MLGCLVTFEITLKLGLESMRLGEQKTLHSTVQIHQAKLILRQIFAYLNLWCKTIIICDNTVLSIKFTNHRHFLHDYLLRNGCLVPVHYYKSLSP